MHDLKVGLVGLYFPNFAAEEYRVYPRAAAALRAMALEWGFELVAAPDAVQTVEQARTARRRFEDADIDFLLVQASSFALSDAFVTLAKMDVPVGIWGVPEPTLEGEIPLNSFTGLNLFASVLRVNLGDRRWPFKWFFDDPEAIRFRERLQLTLRALSALKGLQQASVGLVGDLAPGFPNLAFDSARIRANLDVEVERIRLDDLFAKVEQCEWSAVSSLAEEMSRHAVEVAVANEWMERTARIVLALQAVAEEGSYAALALRCWPEFQEELGGIGPCAAVAWLNEIGLPTACEGDVVGAISMLTLHLLAGQPTTMMDLVTIVEEQDLIHLWHCGPTAPSLADQSGQRITYHPTLDRAKPPGAPRSGASSDLVLKPGPVTVARFDRGASQAFLMSGEVVTGPTRGYGGSRGWVTDLRIAGERAHVRDLVETIACYGVPHHYPLALGDWVEPFRELVAWAGLDVLEIVRYRDHLTTPGGCGFGSQEA